MNNEIIKVAKEIGKNMDIPVEVKQIGNNYYLYKDTTKWDKDKKKRVRVSEYIGKINENGLVEKNRISIYEYANSELLLESLDTIIPNLKRYFPYIYENIIAMSIIKTINNVPIRLMKSQWSKLYASENIDAHLSPNTISDTLKTIGKDFESQRRFFKSIMDNSKYLIFDLSSLFSRSENINIVEKGYNHEHKNIKQINFALIFSKNNKPVILEPLPGSVRDMKSMDFIIKTYELKNSIIIADRGLSSYEVTENMRKNKIDFIIALRRNMNIIDYTINMDKNFIYHDRGINSGVKETSYGYLYIFEDVMMRADEETTFISYIKEGKRSNDDLIKSRVKFGKISILSSLNIDNEEIFKLYKEREEVEQVFDTMKNTLEYDKMYLQDTYSLRGYFFISFISLYSYYSIVQLLKKNNVYPKISVKEVLLELSKIYAIKNSARRYLSEIPEKPKKIADILGVKLYPKILRN